MNAKRRKEIEKIIATLEDARERISSLRDEEEEAFNNLPETLQDADKGLDMQAAYEALESADEGFDDILGYLEEAVNY